ncbi:hypothetical protein QN277_011482 [Acacia crassicarpa]|uniref:TOD1/MUCI70 glycosyltransferase-like domain-containing protein n=1 Tax=Acacia crassicarpa TaxID=499986 RepID=A0AAE1MYW0_9FABA|nr:hypothetical protein QN277_011482 [Acacia crassicarpa]
MAQQRQSGMERIGVRGSHDLHDANGAADHVTVGVYAPTHKHPRHRRSVRSDRTRKLSAGLILVFLFLALGVTVVAYYYLSIDDELNKDSDESDDLKNDSDFLTNVPRIERSRVLEFGNVSVGHGRDSRYWDRDDRRRDGDYNEDAVEKISKDENIDKSSASGKMNGNIRSSNGDSHKGSVKRGVGLYNEAGRHELKKYEAEYEASLKNAVNSSENYDKISNHDDLEKINALIDVDDEYDDFSESQDAEMEDYGNNRNTGARHSNSNIVSDSAEGNISLNRKTFHSVKGNSQVIHEDGQLMKKSNLEAKKKHKRRKFSGSCEMKLLNSTSQIVEPLESRKFVRFNLQYTEKEEKPLRDEQWMPRFAGHQSLEEREKSFLAQDQNIKCGFVRGPEGSPSTGFDLSEDDANYISRCHVAVISCIFGNSDRLRSPATKTVTRVSRKNVCFVMFIDEVTLRTLVSDGHEPDRMGFIGFWKLIVAKNLPYDDMRRVGKIPKLLPHRLFPSARYSIWLDSKLRLQLDPLLILEYFLWRKGYEFAISNHYDRHCVWEEVARNKKLNKYNHTLIDEQFAFYRADGLKRFDASDPNKLLPSNVPEGSFIIRAHTPMTNLFSCLWFNEVDRFTPRDQLSFAYTYQKLRRMNPDKPFHLNMFKDCERRKMAKLFHHRVEEKHQQKATE